MCALEAKHEVDGSLDGTILGKLINKCGKDSNVPAIMALDAIGAGIGEQVEK